MFYSMPVLQRFQVQGHQQHQQYLKIGCFDQNLVPSVSYPAHIVLTLCGDWLEDHILAANAEENLFDLVQEFLGEKKKKRN